MSNVVFRVHMVELEDVADAFCRKHGDHRTEPTLIEADGCTSLKEVCKKVCSKGFHIPDYRNLRSALNGNSWARLETYVVWKMNDSEDGSWGNEFIWRGTYEGDLRARHESIKNIFVGIVRGYDQTVKLLEHGKVEEGEF